MKLSGSYKIPTDKQTVWEALNNPDVLQKCIPGCGEFKKNSEEVKVIAPAIKSLKKNVKISGPHSSDTIFLKKNLNILVFWCIVGVIWGSGASRKYLGGSILTKIK